MLLLLGAVLLPRLVVFPWNENFYGDAVMRTELAERWLRNPHWMTSFKDGPYQFGPVHLYAIAAALKLWPDREQAGRAVSLLFGALTVLPLFFLTRRLFGRGSAVVAALGFACWGMHIQMATTAGSESLSLCLVLCSLSAFSAALSDRRWSPLLLSAAWMNLACATRYDAWMLVGLLCLVLVLRDAKRAVLYGALCSLFPLLWMYGNWKATGDALYPLHFIDAYHRGWWGDGARLFGDTWYRLQNLLFWPATALLTLSPGIALFGMVGLVAEKRHSWLKWIVLVPTAYFTLRGALLANFVPLARFAALQVLLLLPFVKRGFDCVVRSPRFARGLLVATVALAVALPTWLAAFTFRKEGKYEDWFRPVSPTSTNPVALMEAAQWVQQEVAAKGEGMVLDSDDQYRDIQLAFFSGLPEKHLARYRWEDFPQLLVSARPRYLALFAQGALERDGRVKLDEDGALLDGTHFRELNMPKGPVRLFVRD